MVLTTYLASLVWVLAAAQDSCPAPAQEDWKRRFEELQKHYFSASAADRPRALQEFERFFEDTLERSRRSFGECRAICAHFESQRLLFQATKQFEAALRRHHAVYFETALTLSSGPDQLQELRVWCAERKLAEKKSVEELLARIKPPAKTPADFSQRAQLRAQRQHAHTVVQEFLSTRGRRAVEELKKILAWMKKERFASPEARDRVTDLLRRLFGEQAPEYAALGRELEGLVGAASSPSLTQEFDTRVSRLVKDYTTRLMTAVEKCLAANETGLGFEMFRQLLRIDPGNVRAHRALGHVKVEDRWLRPYEAEQYRKGFVWDSRRGWLAAKEKTRYEAGEHLDVESGRWARLDDLNRRHAQADDPWILRSEHFELRSTADLALTVRVMERLEAFYLQAFAEYDLFFARGSDKNAELIFGIAPVDRKLAVRFYRSEEQFKEHAQPPTKWAAGYYAPDQHASFFYAQGDEFSVETLQHELTHQILGEHSASAAPCWLAEGAAVHLQAASFRDGVLTVGDLSQNAWLAEYRARLRSGSKEHGFEDMMRFRTGAQWDSGDIVANYRGAGAVVHFLMTMDGGRHRSDFIDLLRESYNGSERPVEDYFGLSLDALDWLMARYYRECMTSGEEQTGRLSVEGSDWAPIESPSAFGMDDAAAWPVRLAAKPKETAVAHLRTGQAPRGISVRVRVDKGSSMFAGLLLENGKRLVYVDPDRGHVVIGHWGEKEWAFDLTKPCEQKGSYELALVVASGRYVAYLDGREIGRVEAPGSDLGSAAFYVYGGRAAFDQVKVRPNR